MSKSVLMRSGIAVGVLIAVVVVAVGCGGSGGGGPKIALLLPESKTSRYEAHDRPEFEEKVEEICSDCEIIYSNANQSTSEQQSQGEAAITQGANVLVLDAVDATAVGSVVKKASEEGIPVELRPSHPRGADRLLRLLR
jgi:D-xylose transport system substrate-binding protein